MHLFCLGFALNSCILLRPLFQHTLVTEFYSLRVWFVDSAEVMEKLLCYLLLLLCHFILILTIKLWCIKRTWQPQCKCKKIFRTYFSELIVLIRVERETVSSDVSVRVSRSHFLSLAPCISFAIEQLWRNRCWPSVAASGLVFSAGEDPVDNLVKSPCNSGGIEFFRWASGNLHGCVGV